MNVLSLLNENTLDRVTKLVSGLATVAIVSMDLSVPYNNRELNIYTNILFQLLAVFSVAYQSVEDLRAALIVTVLWCVIKYINFRLN